jgi:hypothetical protein
VIQARDAPRAVIFRRGPSTHVLLALWHTDTDRVEEGQWLKGRIYERRADLSPDGTKLLYFAAQFRRREMPTWTAISSPPWLTALVLWPKDGTYGGAGLWESRESIVLNHPYGDIHHHPTTPLPAKLRVREMGKFGGGGEDFPVLHLRLVRDGWRLLSPGGRDGPDFSRSPVWKYDPPIAYARSRPKDPSLEVRMRILGIAARGEGWYQIEHWVVRVGKHGEELVLDLGRAEWADWDHRGDLVLAQGGVLSRVRAPALDLESARVIVDLRNRSFVARVAPAAAREWRWRP